MTGWSSRYARLATSKTKYRLLPRLLSRSTGVTSVTYLSKALMKSVTTRALLARKRVQARLAVLRDSSDLRVRPQRHLFQIFYLVTSDSHPRSTCATCTTASLSRLRRTKNSSKRKAHWSITAARGVSGAKKVRRRSARASLKRQHYPHSSNSVMSRRHQRREISSSLLLSHQKWRLYQLPNKIRPRGLNRLWHSLESLSSSQWLKSRAMATKRTKMVTWMILKQSLDKDQERVALSSFSSLRKDVHQQIRKVGRKVNICSFRQPQLLWGQVTSGMAQPSLLSRRKLMKDFTNHLAPL